MSAAASSDPVTQCIHGEQGFAIYVLANRRVEISVIPELGARVLSLKNQSTGREWMWRPPGPLRLFRNAAGDDFSRSPLAGADECLPTIASCAWQGRQLPDHGEAWSAPWALDPQAWERGIIRTKLTLPISPFTFERSIKIRGNEISLEYCLRNHATTEQRFLWAWHPLLSLQSGDRLVLPDSTRATLDGAMWLDKIDTAVPDGKCSKLVAWKILEGRAAICNARAGDSLSFEWSPAKNRALGVWLNRGGWHGHDHFALEPANSDGDDLSQSAARNHCGLITAGGEAVWDVRIELRP